MFLETKSSMYVTSLLECLQREVAFNKFNNTQSPYSRPEINKQPNLTHFEKVKLVSILSRLSLQVTQRWKCRVLSLDKNRFVPRANDDFICSGLSLYQLWFELQVHKCWCNKWPHLSNTMSFIKLPSFPITSLWQFFKVPAIGFKITKLPLSFFSRKIDVLLG